MDLSLLGVSLGVDFGNCFLSVGSDYLKFSSVQGDLFREILVDAIPLLISSLPQCFKLLLIINLPHLEVILLPFHFVQGTELGFQIQWLLDFFRKLNFSDDDIKKFKTFVAEHLVQELHHGSSVSLSLDIVHLKMGLTPDKHSHSFGDGCLKLFIQLVDADSVDEIVDGLLIRFAPKYYCDGESHKDVVVCWARSHLELILDVLLRHQELDLGPGQAPYEPSSGLYVIKLSVMGDDGVCSLRTMVDF